MTELVPAVHVFEGDTVVVDADTSVTVKSKTEDQQMKCVLLAVDDGVSTTFTWRLPVSALVSVRRKTRKWRRTLVLETTSADRAEAWRTSDLVWTASDVTVVRNDVEEVS